MNLIEDICTKITCPPKFKYSLYDLGSTFLKHGKRTDFNTIGHNNQKIFCSYFQPSEIKFQRSCLIYLHSMNGSRLQSSIYVQSILKMGVSFCCFDFTGCGISEGEGISFGATQKYDVQAVISKIKQLFYINKFILWGRSMGAVCAVKYCEMIYQKSNIKKYEIVGLILDSIFKSFSKLAVQIGSSHSQIPQFLIKAGYLIIKSSIQEKGNFRVEQLQLQKSINKMHIPTIFLASQEDKTVNCQHSIDLYNLYKHNQKKLTFIKGLHNQSRDDQYVKQVKKFVHDTLINQQKKQKASLNSNSNSMLKYSTSKRDLLEHMMMSQNNGEVDDLQTLSTDQVNCFCSILDQNTQQQTVKQNLQQKKKIKFQPILTNQKQSFRKLDSF